MTRRKGATAERTTGPEGPARLPARRSITHRRQDLGLPGRPRCCGPRSDENLAMIPRASPTCVAPGREVIYDAEHFFDGWKAEPRVRAADRPGRGRGRGRDWSCCATPTAAACPRRSPRSPRAAVAALAVPVGIHCHNDCDLAVANSLAAVDAGRGPGAGHDQRLRRALRQRRPDLGHRQPGAQEAGLRGAAARRRRASDRAVAVRLRNGQHELPRRTSRSWARARSPTRAACTSAASPGPRPATSTSTRSWSATSGGCW